MARCTWPLGVGGCGKGGSQRAGELPRVPPASDLTAELPKQLPFTPSAVLMPKSTTFIQRGDWRGCLAVGNPPPPLNRGGPRSLCLVRDPEPRSVPRTTSNVGAPLGGPRSLKHTGKGGNYSQNTLPEKSKASSQDPGAYRVGGRTKRPPAPT